MQQVPDYFEQLAAEQRMRVKDRRGHERWEWRKVTDSRRNEALDCRVYAMAALHSLMVAGFRLDIQQFPEQKPRLNQKEDSTPWLHKKCAS